MTRVAIMQPTYLPWLGYFSMIDYVDKFIYLDSVQFARRSWQQRNRIKSVNGELMMTVPVFSKGLRGQVINETQIDLSTNFGVKHWRSIETAYKKAPYFSIHAEELEKHFLSPPASLADFNISLIEKLCMIFGVSTPRQRSSSMFTSGTKSELLARLCKKAGASSYISAPGSKEYIQESSAFQNVGVTVDYFVYDHPVYFQGNGEFIPYMSAIDLLFNVGAEESLFKIRKSTL